jgi:hypothetical protein
MDRTLVLLSALATLVLAACVNFGHGSAEAAARPEVRYYLIADT